MARLIEKSGGVPTIAPSMREIPLSDNAEVFAFAERLQAGAIGTVVFLTGVGTETLFEALETRGLAAPVQAALARCRVVARGPKPVAALSRRGVRIDLKAPEPNTWQQVAATLASAGVELQGELVAVQEYGVPSREFYDWLTDRGAKVLPVPVYRWDLPADVAPLEAALRALTRGEFEVLLWTSAQQVNHVDLIAQRMGLGTQWRTAARNCVIGSIGPTASERLREFGLPPSLEPSHPRMAHLVRETLERATSGSPLPAE